ncbi:hypothetical protein V1514DRAFT_344619 [Lipomyces japonicus]|uniref:uncharacterized protein n=1 Tax=Lipomyces japonicus TaxID=56871 RepID=UPI0034CF32E6
MPFKQYSISQFYCCYLLRSSKRLQSFYIGSTPLPLRRLRQHNGELLQGAYRTKRKDKRPWNMICIVSGFPSKISALQFEHAWQHSYKTRHILEADRLATAKTSSLNLHKHLGNLRLLFRSKGFSRWPLQFHIFDDEVNKTWLANKFKAPNPHEHVSVVLDLRSAEGIAKDNELLDDSQNDTSLIPSSSQRKRNGTHKIHEGDGLGGIKGLDVSSNPNLPYFNSTNKIITEETTCQACKKSVLDDKQSKLQHAQLRAMVCSNTSCLAVYHTFCLASALLRQKADQDTSRHVIPTHGSCPSCNEPLCWDLLVRNSFWRAAGANTTEFLIEDLMSQDADFFLDLSEKSESEHGQKLSSIKKKRGHSRKSQTDDELPDQLHRASLDEPLTKRKRGRPININAEAAQTSVSLITNPKKLQTQCLRSNSSTTLETIVIPDSEDESDLDDLDFINPTTIFQNYTNTSIHGN